jgi:UDP-MurNAc hydroxylase
VKFTFLGHAGFFVETVDCTVLCDPWKSGHPAFFDSWHVFPPNFHLAWDQMLERTDYLYVSHVHEDHFDRKILGQLVEVNPNVGVIVPQFQDQRFRLMLKDIGFANFEEGELKAGDTRISTYVAETGHREKEDSAVVVSDGTVTFLNANDCDVSLNRKMIKDQFGPIDLYAGQFSSASWHPVCYKYDSQEAVRLSTSHLENSLKRFLVGGKGARKILPIAGPPIFLHKEISDFNCFDGNQNSMFPDAWQIEWADPRICRVVPGYQFTFDSLIDQPCPVKDKKKFVREAQKKFDDAPSVPKAPLSEAKERFLFMTNDILANAGWLRDVIHHKIYVQVEGGAPFLLDFERKEVSEVNEIDYSNATYLLQIPEYIFNRLVLEEITDWESAFLSMRCRFVRNPDRYNPWILALFRNFSKDSLQKHREAPPSIQSENEFFEKEGYLIPRYCPHMGTDLRKMGIFDLKQKTLKCAGHGWKWNLDTGDGINTECRLNVSRIGDPKENKECD